MLALVATTLTGCPFAALPGSAALPATGLVPLNTDTTAEIALGAGAISLADSTWAIYKSADNSLLFRLTFGANGELIQLFDSFVLAQPWLGTEVIPDGQQHATAFAGGSYVFGAYTAEQDGRLGVLGVVHGVFLGTHLGTATISFSGALDAERVDGMFVRSVEIFADTPFDAPDDAEFDAYAVRER